MGLVRCSLGLYLLRLSPISYIRVGETVHALSSKRVRLTAVVSTSKLLQPNSSRSYEPKRREL